MTSVHGISDISDRSGFPGGSEVKNSPADAGDGGSVPDPRGSHMPQTN